MKKETLTVQVEFSEDDTDLDSVASALDTLMETALSSPGILDEYGNPTVGEFLPAEENETLEQIRAELEQPDTDDATYLLAQVYRHLGLPVPAFLKV